MIKRFITSVIILCTVLFCLAESVSSPDNNTLNISAQVWDNLDSINDFLTPATTHKSDKHNISYNIPYNKFLIGNIGLKAYSEQNPQLKVSHPLIKAEDSYYHNYTEVNGQRGYEFYISENNVLSRVDYHTRSWQQLDSQYLTYHFPADSPIPQEAMQILDKRIETFFTYFPEQNHELDSLRVNKLDYFYCPDSDTIERLTSYKTRGIYLLNQDYVISTYPAHFHEVTHFLINYYLKSNELFTHTFLQEGLAVAIGGRGGLSTEALMDAGKFLIDTGMVNYSDYNDVAMFSAEHASLSYPVAGLLTRVMLNHYKPEEYIALYRKYSNSTGSFSNIRELDWLTKGVIDEYVKDNSFRTIFFSCDEQGYRNIYSSETLKISVSKEMLQFKGKGNINFDFKEHSLNESENGRYSLKCSDEEITLTDNLLDEIICSWSINFILSDEKIPLADGYYQFFMKKAVFNLQ
ncbi:MAG: hypothetical protein JXR56_09445 [Candidatus Cloacimonetes bacterium]|nr:hypothetical protein [Candidatus Cloacimonadota bacterium]